MMHNLEMLKILTGVDNIDELSINARPLVGVYGALTVLFTFFLARQIMGVLPALLAAALCGATPMLGVHAQFIKEDIFASPLIIISLLMFIRYRIGTDRSVLVFLSAGALLVCVTLISAYPVVAGRPVDTRVVFMNEFYKQIPGKVLMETFVPLRKSTHKTLGADFAIVSSFT